MTSTRIQKETEKLQKEPSPGVIAAPTKDNPRYFSVIITGPQSSPYEGGNFKLELFLPADYPMVPPKVHMLFASPSPRPAPPFPQSCKLNFF